MYDTLQRIGIVLAIVGIFIAGYMSYSKLADQDVVCVDTGSIDCAGVQNSKYAEIGGIPIALMGLATYITILGLFALEDKVSMITEYGRATLFSITLFGIIEP